jgi:hypothetical protein
VQRCENIIHQSEKTDWLSDFKLAAAAPIEPFNFASKRIFPTLLAFVHDRTEVGLADAMHFSEEFASTSASLPLNERLLGSLPHKLDEKPRPL